MRALVTVVGLLASVAWGTGCRQQSAEPEETLQNEAVRHITAENMDDYVHALEQEIAADEVWFEVAELK